MYHQIILIIHLLAATIWVGGHLILLLRYVPKALKDKTLDDIAFFRKNFEVQSQSWYIFLFNLQVYR